MARVIIEIRSDSPSTSGCDISILNEPQNGDTSIMTRVADDFVNFNAHLLNEMTSKATRMIKESKKVADGDPKKVLKFERRKVHGKGKGKGKDKGPE